ncbi:Predicted Zn-dependent peptidase [Salibacterium halotolerans]|uniref:Predicted Zn-dependent peptidase n=2 Tax=Salibacterium halotolerans TaxID=1884432 RepID=A0A1I5MHP5_9BACI|nr:pitrilysin family protein [Salibacterium halotolerans]SFP09105.1 Predicted Zn-dependent peptidase [Salibacterium halotolerans]
MKRNRLSNGLRVVTEHTTTVQSMTIGIWIKTGSRYETAEENGISHFLEHMFFKGTVHRSAAEIAESFDKIGGDVNAFTSKEYTCFYAKVLDKHTKTALSILADMLFHSTFDQEEIEKEKQVVMEEIKMVEDTPDDIIHDYLDREAFGHHPLARPILGTEESVRAFTRDGILDFRERHYTAGNMVISLVGNESSELIEQLERLFGGLPRGYVEQPFEKPLFLPGKTGIQKETEQAHLCIGFPGAPMDDEAMYPLMLMNNALGDSMSSRLFQRIREDRGLAYSVFSYHVPFLDTGMLTIYAGTGLKQQEEAAAAVFEVVENIAADGLTDKEIENGKEQLKGNIILGLESTSSRMSRNGKNELMLGRHRTLEDTVQRLDHVTKEDIQQTASAMFRSDYALSFISDNGLIPSVGKENG